MRHITYDHGEVIADVTSDDLQPATVRTPLEILSDLTEAEYTALWQAAQGNAQMARWFDMLRAASEVRSDDPRTVAGLQIAASVGLLTVARIKAVFGVEVKP